MQTDTKLARASGIPALTGLRFFAAFFIVLAHGLPKVVPVSGDQPSWYMLLSTLYGEGMTLFFVLSGFVIHYNYSIPIRQNPMLGIYNFLIARIARLYPLFLVGLAYDLCHHFGYSTLTSSFREVIPYYLTLTHSWFYIPMGKNALIFQFGLIPQVSWSISTEWFFYLFYPIVCFGLIKIPRVRTQLLVLSLLCVFCLSILALFTIKESAIDHWAGSLFGAIANAKNGVQDSFSNWLVYYSPYFRINEFFVGCLTASIYMRISHNKPSLKEEHIGLILFFCSLIGIAVLHYFAFARNPWVASLWIHSFAKNLILSFGFAPFIAMIIFCCARYRNIFSRFLSTPGLLLCGDASFSIYLFHLVVFEAFSRDAAAANSWPVYLADFVRFFFAFAAVMGLAILSYRVIEVPARRVLRRMLIIRAKPVVELQTL